MDKFSDGTCDGCSKDNKIPLQISSLLLKKKVLCKHLQFMTFSSAISDVNNFVTDFYCYPCVF